MTLLHPAWLLLALAVPAIWFWPRRLQDVRLGLLRSLVLLLVVLAAARPVAFTRGEDAWHVIVLDAHGSTDDAAEADALALARRLEADLGDDGRTVFVRIGASGLHSLRSVDDVLDDLEGDHFVVDENSESSLSRGLEAAVSRGALAGARPAALIEPYLRALQKPARDVLRQPADIAPLGRVARLWLASVRGRF